MACLITIYHFKIFTYITLDGQWAYFLLRVTPVFSQKGIGLSGVVGKSGILLLFVYHFSRLVYDSDIFILMPY